MLLSVCKSCSLLKQLISECDCPVMHECGQHGIQFRWENSICEVKRKKEECVCVYRVEDSAYRLKQQ